MKKITGVKEIPKSSKNNIVSVGPATIAYGGARTSGLSHEEAIKKAQKARQPRKDGLCP